MIELQILHMIITDIYKMTQILDKTAYTLN